MVCELVPGGPRAGAGRAGGAAGAERARELRQGGAGADLRGSARRTRTTMRCSTTTSRASWRRSTPATGAKTPIGRPAIFSIGDAVAGRAARCSSAEIKKPFSHLIPMNGFPQDVEIWTRDGELAKKFAELPSREGTPLTGVEPGPRSYQWRADQPATIVWVEALDGGDLKNKVPFRDKVLSLAAPFTAPADRGGENRVALRRHRRTPTRGVALLNENDRASRRTRTWILEPARAPRKVWDRKQDAAYDNPGTPVARRDSGVTGGGRGGGGSASPIIQNGDYIYLSGAGRLAGRRSAVPRSAEREDAADRADLQVVVRIARIVRRAAERRDDALPDALRDAEGSAELLRARRRRDGEAAGDAVQGSAAAGFATSSASTSPTSARTASRCRERSTCRPATSRARRCR